jgi:hypothetical protein
MSTSRRGRKRGCYVRLINRRTVEQDECSTHANISDNLIALK